MPELPEVEVIAQGLREYALGETIEQVEIRWAGAIDRPDPATFADQLVGRTVTDVGRRGKFLVLAVPPAHLLIHLRMSGRLLYCEAADEAARQHPHVRALLRFVSGRWLVFRDMRKFGRLYLVDNPQAVTGRLGVEPLSEAFTVEALARVLQRRRQIKPLLLDQRMIAGLGNIYADESLWEAGIHPARPASTLSEEQAAALCDAVRRVLRRAIAHKGTTLRDYRSLRDEEGAYQLALSVYDREGEPCARCGATIERIVVGGRGTRYCPTCQRLDNAQPPSQPG